MGKVFWSVLHRSTATEDYTGAAAGGDVTQPAGDQSAGIHVLHDYAADAAGGLFDPYLAGLGRPAAVKVLTLERVVLAIGGQSAWSLLLVDAAGATRATVASGTNETSYVLPLASRFEMLPGERLKLSTTDMTETGSAVVTWSLEG